MPFFEQWRQKIENNPSRINSAAKSLNMMKTITENLSVRMRTVPPPKPDSPEIDTILDGIDLLGEIAEKLRLQRWQGLSQTIEQAQAQAPTSGSKPRPDPFGPK